MREYYINEQGQKRRLRFHKGDMVICEDVNGNLAPYMVCENYKDRTLLDLRCAFCSRLIATGFDKKSLQEFIYGCKPHDVLTRKEFRDLIVAKYPGRKVSNCIAR